MLNRRTRWIINCLTDISKCARWHNIRWNFDHFEHIIFYYGSFGYVLFGHYHFNHFYFGFVLCFGIHSSTVSTQHLTCSGNLESTHLNKVVDDLQVLNVLVRILAHLVCRSLRTDMREFCFPITQRWFAYSQHLSYLLNGIVEF